MRSLANAKSEHQQVLLDLLAPYQPSESTIEEAKQQQQQTETSFTCQDKLANVAYADLSTDCHHFFVCIEIGKGKLMPYKLKCNGETRFNQLLSMCVQQTDLNQTKLDRTCRDSVKYFAYNKWYSPSKKHFAEVGFQKKV